MTAAVQIQSGRARKAALALAEALAARVELTEKLSEAIVRSDAAQAVPLVGAVQKASRAVNLAGESLGEMDLEAPAEAEMRSLLGRMTCEVQAADARLHAVLEATGASRLQGWIEEADLASLTEAPWNARRDLIVLLGTEARRLVAPLSARGQQRIFCQAAPGEQVPGAITISRIEDLDTGCWRLGLPLPERFRMRVVGAEPLSPEATATRLQEALPNIHGFGHALKAHAPRFLQYCARNLAQLATRPTCAQLDGIFKGVPAVVVAAGPSLDKNIARLRELKGKAVIIAINQTVRALREAGVQSDIVLACDWQNLAYQFDGVKKGEIPALGLSASVHPDLFQVPADRLFTVAASPIIESWAFEALGVDASLPAGGTVAISALHLAVRMGCSPVVTVGLDLALAGDKYYSDHAADGGPRLASAADGSLNLSTFESKVRLGNKGQETEYRDLLARKLDLVEVRGFYGQDVKTTVAMRQQLLALRAHVGELKSRATLLNATEGGAFIEGVEHVTLASVVDRCRDIQVDAPAALARALTPPPAQERRAQLRKRLTQIVQDLERAVALAGRCRRALKSQGTVDPKSRDRLGEITRRLPFAPVLLTAQLEQVDRAVSGEAVTLCGIDSAETALYTAIETEGRSLQPLLEEAVKRLE